MPTHSQETPNFTPAALELAVFGHDAAVCAEVAALFHGKTNFALQSEPDECDLAIFVIDPAQGIDQVTISQWESLDESMVPRLVAVVGLENSQADFDDAVMLANRVFAQTITPYLVLHDDAGVACALIRLEDLSILNYETFPPTIQPSDSEHQTLVSEFRAEYEEATQLMGPDAFAAGLLFPAIPLWIEKKIGVDIILQYIEQVANSRI